MAKVFIDGEAGTTGLQIRDRLAGLDGLDVISIDEALRKDEAARQDMMREADVIILCLPDDAAREAVVLVDALGGDAPRVIDASTAHRTADGWVYGFAELFEGQASRIAAARKVSNPGCYPTGAIALLRPLIDAGLMPSSHSVSINAVSGYSGGGKSMIADYEAGTADAFQLYGLALHHKHVTEMQLYSGLTTRPIFIPSVAAFAQGMLVSIPLHLSSLTGKPTAGDIATALTAHYDGAQHVRVTSDAINATKGKLEPQGLNGTDDMELFVFADDTLGQAVLVARLDNLGKGAAGAAVQNLKLMVGLSD
ncbi:MAG: N-acetyl-gamma-glutamyl-phosphate reductase [Alphaproteobacteria bacterium BRH_c36]|nr:MAG: N-acetyl-gamma-glutamyl-phosphate reductase [Alphaproteobacteria bacterium BRH_c36]